MAGVAVTARVCLTGVDGQRSEEVPEVRLGRADTDADGAFTIETDAADEHVARWACALQSCPGFALQLSCLDRDDRSLHETQALPYRGDEAVQIELDDAGPPPRTDDWAALGRAMLASRTVRLVALAHELTSLAPQGLFRDWTVARRLAVLRRIEQALLDPSDGLADAQLPVSFERLGDERSFAELRERAHGLQRPELAESLDAARERALRFGDLREIDVVVDIDRLARGDIVAGVNRFREPGFSIFDLYPWMKSPLAGYRDYLRDRWCDHQRFEPVLGGPNAEVASRATMFARLSQRLHQRFDTHDETDQPANRVLIPILTEILTAPTGAGYGFGIAPAAIEAMGERTHREHVDYLVALSGLEAAELEKRYRLNLRRSDFERSNPVQQNVDTLQRFFTDSYQSVDDPHAIAPDRKPGTPEPLISSFPKEAAGPFFLQYEEWLAREEPFFPENHYDPRATYGWTLHERLQKTRELIVAASMPLAAFIETPKAQLGKFVPGGGLDHRAAKVQWLRNHIDLHDVIVAAHQDARSLNPVAAEGKYAWALAAVKWLRDFAKAHDAWWDYQPAAFAKEQKNADVSTVEKLAQYERRYHRGFGQHYESGSIASDFLTTGEISDRWWGKPEAPFFWPGNRRELRYLLDYLQFRLLPACLSEVQLSLGKYADAVRQLVGYSAVYQQTYRWFGGPAAFNIFAATLGQGGALPIRRFDHHAHGPLAYASDSERTEHPPPDPPTSVPTNRAELGWFKLKLGNAALEWADVLYRSNQPDSIMRARELYKAVIFLHGEDPEITPRWGRRKPLLFPLPGSWKAAKGNPAIAGQVGRGRLGMLQIDAGLNWYGVSPTVVPPVRYRVLKESADRFAAGARGAQSDFLDYMQQLDQLSVSEMTARTMVAKSSAALSIAREQQKIAEFAVGEAQKQVDAINAQIAAKKAEIAKKDAFFEQLKDFAGGMKDSVMKLGEMAFAGEAAPEAASAGKLSTGDILSLGFKVGTASNALGAGASALGGAAGVAGPFGAFLYAGVTSMGALADAIAKRAGELAHLQNAALPAAKALVDLKKRDVTIAQLSQAIAQADWQLGKDLLAYYAQRFLNRSFLVSMAEFSNRLMRRYLDLAGKTGWLAERALAFEQDRELAVIGFDYYPRHLRGVSGADLLQLHLAELEAARVQGLTQTIPVKQTVSLARDFPIALGQLKKTGTCRFATREAPLRLLYPGVYGYRVRNISIAATYAAALQPHRGVLTNQGVSIVTRSGGGPGHVLARYADALPLSEFRMREDMWVYDLPDETLLPFEGSGIETTWELTLSPIGNAEGFAAMSDMLITFDMRASYSALLAAQDAAAAPASVHRSVLMSANAANPGALATFRADGGVVALAFDVAAAVRNPHEATRTLRNLVLIAVGADAAPFDATLASTSPALSAPAAFEAGLAMSNAGILADGNGGVPLPLNAFAGQTADLTLTLEIDSAANPGVDFSGLREVMLWLEYEATL
ncbi:MAG TPA: hypothetical protein VHM00_08995 [Caldimonas sp.]|nr:hypothetical protein [Caldimonas sp.]HEX2541206.1 hypothetical protein [Caldimonas sp.]